MSGAAVLIRVLLVEDDEKLGELLRRLLALDGIETDVAGDAEQALTLAAAFPYDAVVLDWMLPGMDGLELCRRLRRGGLRAPVVMISARDDLTARDLADAGVDEFLGKPFAVGELERCLTTSSTPLSWGLPDPTDHALRRAGRGWWSGRRRGT